MIRIDARCAEEEASRSPRRSWSFPTSGERITPTRFSRRPPGSIEGQFDRILQRGGGRDHACKPAVIRDARKRGRPRLEPWKSTRLAEQPNERRVDPGTRRLVARPVERDAFLRRVVARRVCREVAAADEEQPDVSAADSRDRAALAQQAVDRPFPGMDLGPASAGSDENHPRESLGRRRAGKSQREGNEPDHAKDGPHGLEYGRRSPRSPKKRGRPSGTGRPPVDAKSVEADWRASRTLRLRPPRNP